MAEKEEKDFVMLLMKWYSKQKATKDTIVSDKVEENVKV